MAFSVEDFQDLLQLLEQRPEWRAQLRRHMLPDELLEVPALVRQLVEAQSRTEAQLSALTARVDALAEAQVHTGQQIAALVEAQRCFDDHLKRQDDRIGELRGWRLEDRYRQYAHAYFGELVRHLRTVDKGTLIDMLDELIDRGRLTAADRRAIMWADVVVTGTRRDDQTQVYLLAEVSAVVEEHDVRRAEDRAAMLARLGRPVVPIVAGESIEPEAANLARARRLAGPGWADHPARVKLTYGRRISRAQPRKCH